MEETILIIAAMEDIELNYLKTKLNNLKNVEYKGIKVFEGELADKRVVLCESGIGLINATFSVAIAIENYNPTVIINIGLARRFNKRCAKRKYSNRNRRNKYNINGVYWRWKHLRRL